MILETPADACAALAVLIAGADEVSTTEERRFLFGTMAATPLLEHLDEAQLADLLATASEWVVSSFPRDGGHVSDEGVSELIGLICGAIPPELRTEAFQAAVGLARSDGFTTEEERLLELVWNGLEIDPETARELLDGHS